MKNCFSSAGPKSAEFTPPAVRDNVKHPICCTAGERAVRQIPDGGGVIFGNAPILMDNMEFRYYNKTDQVKITDEDKECYEQE